ncbi:MAG: hypothetical protein C0518_00620 [Opitutus sp.]|nr:hypothetical protein [Opitutus sp.]
MLRHALAGPRSRRCTRQSSAFPRMTGLEIFSRFYDREAPLQIVDAGAHVGNSVASFLELFPRATVHAFEPAPANYQILASRFEGHPSVRVHQAALGAQKETVQLHLNNYDATHSVIPIAPDEIARWADAADIRSVGQVEVQQVALDGYLAEQNLSRLDILKLDIQGGELSALRGAAAALSAHRIDCVFSEVEFRAIYAGQPLAWDLHRFFASHAYEFVNFVCPKVTDAGLLSWADAVYVNRTLWSRLRAAHLAGKMRSPDQI